MPGKVQIDISHTEMTKETKKGIAALWLLFLVCGLLVTLFIVVPLKIIGVFFLIGTVSLLFVASVIWAINQVTF